MLTGMMTFSPECLDAMGSPVTGDPFEIPGDCFNYYQVRWHVLCSEYGYIHCCSRVLNIWVRVHIR